METNFFNICSNFSMTVCVEHCIRCSLVWNSSDARQF